MQTQHELWQAVRAALTNWECLENVDRGYDFKACSQARDHYYRARGMYEVWFGVKWEQDSCPPI